MTMAWKATPAEMFDRRCGLRLRDRASTAKRMLAPRLTMTLLLATLPCALLVLRSSAAENDQGAQIAAMCAACHRLDGLDEGIPTIIGLDPKKLAGVMAEFKSGKRTSQIMNVVARSLSDEEIAALARYLATLKKGAERQ